MSISLARTAEAWWAVTLAGGGPARPARRHDGGAARRPGRPGCGDQGRAGRQMSRDAQPLLTLTGLSKAFPGLRGLDGVDFGVHSGETADDVAWLSMTGPGPGRGRAVPPALSRCRFGGYGT